MPFLGSSLLDLPQAFFPARWRDAGHRLAYFIILEEDGRQAGGTE
jgi:hypothetical protein